MHTDPTGTDKTPGRAKDHSDPSPRQLGRRLIWNVGKKPLSL